MVRKRYEPDAACEAFASDGASQVDGADDGLDPSGQSASLWAALTVPTLLDETIVDNAAIRFRTWQNVKSRRRPAILVHGMLAHARWWDIIAGFLVEDRPVVALDFSGMGDSDWRTSYSRETHAREVIAVAQATSFERPLLVAHSYGGGVAMEACRQAPELFRCLVLLDSRLELPGSRPLPPPPGASENLVRKTYPSFEAARARFRLTPDSHLANSVALAHIARHSIRQVDGAWAWKFDPTAARDAMREQPLETRPINVPLVFVRGSESPLTTPHQLHLMKQHLPEARLLSMPAAGHHIMVDQPIGLVAMLRALFRDE